MFKLPKLFSLFILLAIVAFGSNARADSTVHALTATTANPAPAGSCIYIDSGPGQDTKTCANYLAVLGASSPPPIGNTAPNSGAFTTLSASGAVSGAGFTALFASPPSIGSTAPGTGAFTTLSASSTVSGAGFTALFASPPAIGGTAPAAGAFTTLSATSTVSGAGITALFASPPSIGNTAPGTGAFTTLSASSTVSGAGFSTYLASPPAIGGTAPAAGSFTTLSATGNLTTNITGGGTQCVHVNNAGLASGTGSDCGAGGSTAFSGLTSGTNTTAAMVVGTGASLNFTGSGTINASTLGGATFAAPGPIGSGTPGTGAFTTLSASSTVSGSGFSTYLASPPAIGGTVPAAGNFTTLGATGSLTTNITGSTQCVHVNSSGLASGTGSDCGSGGGSGISVSDGTHVITPTTALVFGNGFVVSGSTLTATTNLTVIDNTKSADYTIGAGDMANAVALTGAHNLTLPAVSSTIFQPGMTVSIANTGSSNWTPINNTGLTTNLLTPIVPGTNGALVANANGTALDFYGLQTASPTALGGFFSKSCGGGQFIASLNTDGTATCSTPAGGGNVSTSGGITTNGMSYWASATGLASTGAPVNGQFLVGQTGSNPLLESMSQDCTMTAAGVVTCLKTNNVSFSSLATTVPGTGVAAALGINTGTTGAFLLNNVAREEATGWIAGVNPGGAQVFIAANASTIKSIVGNVETPVGSATTVSVYKAASGTGCNAGTGTVLHSGSFNANGTAATNQTLTVTVSSLNIGDRVCLGTTGGSSWTSGVGFGGITVSITTP